MFSLVALIWAFSHVVIAPLGLAIGSVAPGSARAWLALTSGAWTLSAALMLVRPVEDRVGHLLFRIRRPTRAERARIDPIWAGICARAGADPARYLLRVESSELVNAFALGGHFVAVTRVALDLPDDMLEAVMAHELGHHRDLHPLATGLAWWYLLPFMAADWCLRRVGRATRSLGRLFARLRARAGRISAAGGPGVDGVLGIVGVLVVVGALVAVGVVAIVLLGVFWLPLFVSVRVSRVLQATLSRSAEYAADRHAVELGFGTGLARVLELFVPAERQAPRARGIRALLRTHPSCLARIEAIHQLPGRSRSHR